MASAANGDPAAPLHVGTPVQILTPRNVNSAAYDSSGNYVGVADYEQQFKKLWHVS